jgi:5'-nucleotidase
MAKKLRILVTNDDGYFSEGINALFEELAKTSVVYMVAPDREQSASSHSLTLSHPLRMHKIDRYRYVTDGTPTDCVMLGMHLIFEKRRPDFIISGINHGANMGDDVTYSGTVAAAIEGAILRIPSIAVSMANHEPGLKMARAARFVSRLVKSFRNFNLPPTTFLNVNFPPDNGRPYRRWAFTTQGSRQYKDIVIRKIDPRGKDYYWIGGRPSWKKREGSDFTAVDQGFVSITPMQAVFTDKDVLDELKLRRVKI